MDTKKLVTNNYKENHAPCSKLTGLAPQQMNKIRENGLCFNYDIKYNKGHKCGENILFYI